ncbi:MAG: serine hydrolase domain-containing protein [Vicinamibacteria bacterium]
MQEVLYSSFATALIQGIVESVSGLGFEDYLRRNVWDPAGMKFTQFDLPGRVVVGRADGYERENGGSTEFRRVLQEDVSYKYASGGMISTVDDLCRFGEALLTGRLLSEATRTAMWTTAFTPSTPAMPQYNARDKEHPYTEPETDGIFGQALIWRIATDKQGRTFIYHPGEVKGTLTQLIIYPKEGLVIALQYNTETLGPKRFPRFDALAFADLFLE